MSESETTREGGRGEREDGRMTTTLHRVYLSLPHKIFLPESSGKSKAQKKRKEEEEEEEEALPAFAHAAERTHSSATESTFFFFESKTCVHDETS